MVKSRTPEQERQRWVEREWLQERLRVPVDPSLPTPDPVVVDEFIDFLISIDQKVCRPPRQASKLLAFIVAAL